MPTGPRTGVRNAVARNAAGLTEAVRAEHARPIGRTTRRLEREPRVLRLPRELSWGSVTRANRKQTIAFLGPRATFHEQALLAEADLADAELMPMASIADVLEAAHAGTVDLALAAIENSIEGGVNITLDALAFDLDLLIQREVILHIDLCLVAREGVVVDDIKRIVSFPHAIAQCHKYLAGELPDVAFDTASSTAEAAQNLAEQGSDDTAAIATARAAEAYDLNVLAADIEDHPENRTRFVLVARDGIPPPTGHDKTSIVAFQRANRPGSLVNILQEFSARAINLSHLQSRPTKRELGDYCFVIDLVGHIADERVGDCLKNIHAKQADVRFLGSYPAAGDQAADVRRDANQAWDDAEGWLAGLRDRIG